MTTFDNIPPELRNEIYKLALIMPSPIIVGSPNSVIPGLLRTSKSIRKETARMYWSRNTFVFDRPTRPADLSAADLSAADLSAADLVADTGIMSFSADTAIMSLLQEVVAVDKHPQTSIGLVDAWITAAGNQNISMIKHIRLRWRHVTVTPRDRRLMFSLGRACLDMHLLQNAAAERTKSYLGFDIHLSDAGEQSTLGLFYTGCDMVESLYPFWGERKYETEAGQRVQNWHSQVDAIDAMVEDHKLHPQVERQLHREGCKSALMLTEMNCGKDDGDQQNLKKILQLLSEHFGADSSKPGYVPLATRDETLQLYRRTEAG